MSFVDFEEILKTSHFKFEMTIDLSSPVLQALDNAWTKRAHFKLYASIVIKWGAEFNRETITFRFVNMEKMTTRNLTTAEFGIHTCWTVLQVHSHNHLVIDVFPEGCLVSDWNQTYLRRWRKSCACVFVVSRWRNSLYNLTCVSNQSETSAL